LERRRGMPYVRTHDCELHQPGRKHKNWSNVWNTQRVINTGCSMEAASRSSPIVYTLPPTTGAPFTHRDFPTSPSSFFGARGRRGTPSSARLLLRSPTLLSPSVRAAHPRLIFGADHDRAEPHDGARRTEARRAAGSAHLGSPSPGAAVHRRRADLSLLLPSCPAPASRERCASGCTSSR
jgi:hypothetical protein